MQANSRKNERAVRMYGYFRFIYTRVMRARCLLFTGHFGRIFSNPYKEQMKDTLFLSDISDSFSELYIDKTFCDSISPDISDVYLLTHVEKRYAVKT